MASGFEEEQRKSLHQMINMQTRCFQAVAHHKLPPCLPVAISLFFWIAVVPPPPNQAPPTHTIYYALISEYIYEFLKYHLEFSVSLCVEDKIVSQQEKKKYPVFKQMF